MSLITVYSWYVFASVSHDWTTGQSEKMKKQLPKSTSIKIKSGIDIALKSLLLQIHQGWTRRIFGVFLAFISNLITHHLLSVIVHLNE